MKFQIRKATRADIDVICELVRELASYEKMSDQVTFTNEITQKPLSARVRAG